MVVEIVDDCDLGPLEVIIDFKAEITHPKHTKDQIAYHLDLVKKYVCGIWYECQTPWLEISTEYLRKPLGEILTEYLDDNYPDFIFDQVEITGYNIQK